MKQLLLAAILCLGIICILSVNTSMAFEPYQGETQPKKELIAKAIKKFHPYPFIKDETTFEIVATTLYETSKNGQSHQFKVLYRTTRRDKPNDKYYTCSLYHTSNYWYIAPFNPDSFHNISAIRVFPIPAK